MSQESETLPAVNAASSVPDNTREFRAALGCFATGVTIITARGPRDELIGITANSFNSVSMSPPLVLFSLGRRTYSLQAFLSTHNFAVNVLADNQRDLAARFARALVDKWTDVDFVLTDTGCPFLAGALACFECRIQHTYEGGDHVIFVGEVLRFEHRPAGRPLLYYRGEYACLPDDRKKYAES